MDRNASFLHCFLEHDYIVGVRMIRIHKITIELWRLEWTKAAPIAEVSLEWLTPERLYSLIKRGFTIKPRSELV